MTTLPMLPSASLNSVGAPEMHFAAQYPARTCPCERFTFVLADAGA